VARPNCSPVASTSAATVYFSIASASQVFQVVGNRLEMHDLCTYYVLYCICVIRIVGVHKQMQLGAAARIDRMYTFNTGLQFHRTANTIIFPFFPIIYTIHTQPLIPHSYTLHKLKLTHTHTQHTHTKHTHTYSHITHNSQGCSKS